MIGRCDSEPQGVLSACLSEQLYLGLKLVCPTGFELMATEGPWAPVDEGRTALPPTPLDKLRPPTWGACAVHALPQGALWDLPLHLHAVHTHPHTPPHRPETSATPWKADAASSASIPAISRVLPLFRGGQCTTQAPPASAPPSSGHTAPLCPLRQDPPHRLKEVLFHSRSLLLSRWQTHKPFFRPRGAPAYKAVLCRDSKRPFPTPPPPHPKPRG